MTADLQEEFDAQTQTLLRRRFIRFSGVMGLIAAALLLVSITAGLIVLILRTDEVGAGGLSGFVADRLTPNRQMVLTWGFGVALVAAYSTCYVLAKRGRFYGEGMLRLTYTLVVADGLLHIGGRSLNAPGMLGLWAVMVTHIIACSFLPWTAMQALRPLLPIWAINTLLITFLTRDNKGAVHLVGWSEIDWGILVLRVLLSLMVATPGVVICLIRTSRRMEEFKLAFFQKRYGQVRRELFDARKIHEALFPQPMQDGAVQFTYLYEPMHQIGGDYLYAARTGPGSPLSLVLLDVTGHGIPAALTVNRLHGELQRLFAEDPNIGPGRVLSLLNRYVHLTLADHAVFVTAMCLRIDAAANTVEYASGGHPTAYLRAVDGTVHELASTGLLLGAIAYEEFVPDSQSMKFHAGDTLIAYTDGAIEARDAHGRMLGLKGMQRLVAGLHSVGCGEWPHSVLKAVKGHRNGPPDDDTLVVEVYRPVGGPKTAASPASVKASRHQPV